MNEQHLGWGEYEIVLRIAEAGSLSTAARRLGSSHPTLFRKINAIEAKLGVRLFDRFRTGYQLTAAGEEVAEAARAIEELARNTERRVAGHDLRPSGVVRLATTDTLFHGLLLPEIATLERCEPDIELDVTLSNEISDLSYREADIAIRPADAPEEHLVGRRLGLIRQAIYVAASAEQENLPSPDWATLTWVGPSGSMPYGQLQKWMREHTPETRCSCRGDSVLAMQAAVRAGLGVAVLPCYLAASDDGLQQIGSEIEALAVDLWLLTHPDIRRTARIRAVFDHFSRAIGARLVEREIGG